MTDQRALAATDESALLTALERALPIVAKARSVDHAMFFQVRALKDAPDSAPAELLSLLKLVESIPALEFFQHAQQCCLGYSQPVDHLFVVSWLISRAQQVGVEQTVRDLARYLASETVEVTTTLVLDGFNLTSSITLGDYELVPWSAVPLTDTKWQIEVTNLFGGHHPTAALLSRTVIPRTHLRPWDTRAPGPLVSLEPAIDTLRCATAAAAVAFRLLHHWHEPPDWAPWAITRTRFGVDATSHTWSTGLADATIVSQVQQCARQFLQLDESKRLRLRVPLDRLNRSFIAGFRSVDAAIELGVALESVYAPNKLSEGISLAVRTRAARFLGGSLEDRKATVSTLKDVYDLRSKAVHAGRFDADGGNKWRDESRVRATLEKGQRLVGRSLVKVIMEGEPDWEEFDISEAPST